MGITRQKKTGKKNVPGICFRNSKDQDQRNPKFGREKGPGGRTCNAAATWALKDLSSKTNFLANRGTAEKTTDFQP